MPQAPLLLMTTLFLAPSAGDAELPWTVGSDYKFLWIVDKQKVGETLLQFKKAKSEAKSDQELYTLTASRRYEHKGTFQKVKGTLTFKPDGTPVSYEEECDLTPPMSHLRAIQELRIGFSDGKAETTYVNNRRRDRAVRTEAEVPPRTFLFATHALEHWTVLTLAIKGVPRKTLNVFYPEQSRVMRIKFEREEEEPVRIGNRDVQASRYSFECKKAGYRGKVWLDATGRLLRYESGPLRFALVAPDG